MGMGSSVFKRLSFPVSLFFWAVLYFWGKMGIDKWPAHSVRFSRRLERMEEWKNKERGGRGERRNREREREREVKANRDEETGRQQRTNRELNWAWTVARFRIMRTADGEGVRTVVPTELGALKFIITR